MLVPAPMHRFFCPFYSGVDGRIVGLASEEEGIRDGFAVAQIQGMFPIYEYTQIRVVPGRPDSKGAGNLIMVGSFAHFLDQVTPGSSKHPKAGIKPLPLAKSIFGPRLEAILAESCFAFDLDPEKPGLVNIMTGKEYRSSRDANAQLLVDYGVCRRVFRGPSENTISVEGVHRAGTMGVAKAITDVGFLNSLWQAVGRLDQYEDSRLLEILVQTRIFPAVNQVASALDELEATPLVLAYDRRWLFDLVHGGEWVDVHPWDTAIAARGHALPAIVNAGEKLPTPRLEIGIDLTEADRAVVDLCRRLLTPPTDQAGMEEIEALASGLMPLANHSPMEFVKRGGSRVRLPHEHRGNLAYQVKRLFFLLGLYRLFGKAYTVEGSSVRRLFPQFRAGKAESELGRAFVGGLVGKRREEEAGFEPLLGESNGHMPTMDCQKVVSRVYQLELSGAALVFKFRFQNPEPPAPKQEVKPRARKTRTRKKPTRGEKQTG